MKPNKQYIFSEYWHYLLFDDDFFSRRPDIQIVLAHFNRMKYSGKKHYHSTKLTEEARAELSETLDKLVELKERGE